MTIDEMLRQLNDALAEGGNMGYKIQSLIFAYGEAKYREGWDHAEIHHMVKREE